MARPRILNGIAYGLVHQFTSSCEHILYLMFEHRIEEMQANLLDRTIEQSLLRIPRNLNLIRMVAESLDRVMPRFPTVHLETATLFTRLRIDHEIGKLRTFSTVDLVATDGRQWCGRIVRINPLLAR